MSVTVQYRVKGQTPNYIYLCISSLPTSTREKCHCNLFAEIYEQLLFTSNVNFTYFGTWTIKLNVLS